MSKNKSKKGKSKGTAVAEKPLLFRNRYSEDVEPFERVTLTDKTSCRGCENTARIAMDEEKQDRPDKALYTMQAGQDAIKLTISRGLTGVAYFCLDCASKLRKNLKRATKKTK